MDSVALVHQPLEVEGLNVGTAQGYGVGKWGLLVDGSRTCVRGLIRDWQDEVDTYLGTDKAEKFYAALNDETRDPNRAIKYLNQITDEVRALEIANMWDITRLRSSIFGNIKSLPESRVVAEGLLAQSSD